MSINNAKLLSDLQDAEYERSKLDGCPLCILIRDTHDQATQDALRIAAAGTIGRDKLVQILRDNKTGIGRRTLVRHRQEGHKP